MAGRRRKSKNSKKKSAWRKCRKAQERSDQDGRDECRHDQGWRNECRRDQGWRDKCRRDQDGRDEHRRGEGRRDQGRRDQGEKEHRTTSSGGDVLFMRGFGKAREVLNVTRTLAGLKTELIQPDDVRTPDTLTIEKDDLKELKLAVHELQPHLRRLCQAKAQSTADKAKAAAEKAAKAEAANTPPPDRAKTVQPSNVIVPFKRGRVLGVHSLYIRASGEAKLVADYIRRLSGLPEKPGMPFDTLEIDGEHLEELLVSLEKLSGHFKKAPRVREEDDRRTSTSGPERRESERHDRTRRPPSYGAGEWCRYHRSRLCPCQVYQTSLEELIFRQFLHDLFF